MEKGIVWALMIKTKSLKHTFVYSWFPKLRHQEHWTKGKKIIFWTKIKSTSSWHRGVICYYAAVGQINIRIWLFRRGLHIYPKWPRWTVFCDDSETGGLYDSFRMTSNKTFQILVRTCHSQYYKVFYAKVWYGSYVILYLIGRGLNIEN